MYKDHKKYKVLVIEDNPGDFALIEDYLQEYIANPETIQAKSFKEAEYFLCQTDDCPYDVVLLDLSLPDGSGEQLIFDLNALEPGCPVIILSGYSDFEFSVRSLSLGVSDYLIKDDLSPSVLYKSLVYNIERKRILHDLEESKSRYSHLFHLSPQPMYVFDLESLKFLDVNQATIGHYGFSREEFLSMTIKEIRPAEEVVKLENLIQSSRLTQKPFHGMAKHRKKNGDIIHVEVKTNFIKFKDQDAILVLSSDITERLKYIKTIEKQNQQMREIAWIQSHVVRAPIARLMGLVNLIDLEKATDKDHKELLTHIMDSAEELDKIVREINTKTKEM
ncbi:response regulator [Litoribacter ruber]|uniref:response regulator n=1 Tax=Litoribacter ruber TaxID=702568 RepID=UPI00293D51FA|nr:response regulator [Litoribacter alkaliphilus]